MKQLVLDGARGTVDLITAPAPAPKPGEILVRVHASAASAGTERAKIAMTAASWIGKAHRQPQHLTAVKEKWRRDGLRATWTTIRARLKQIRPIGYAAAGEVIAVDPDMLPRYQIGDRVAVAGAGMANHAEIVRVPAPLVTRLPDGVSFDCGCFATLAAIALHGVRLAEIGLGDRVAIIGLGMIGQLAAQLAHLQGARIYGIDPIPHRRLKAQQAGAEAVLDPAHAKHAIMTATEGQGVDAILIASDAGAPYTLAAKIARDRAVVVLIGAASDTLPHGPFMAKELTLKVARSYGPGRYDPAFEAGRSRYPIGWVRWTETENLAEVVRQMNRDNGLSIAPLITHRLDLSDIKAYRAALADPDTALGIVFQHRPTAPEQVPPRPRQKRTTITLGIIGCGNFAQATLLPALRAHQNVAIRKVTSDRGVSAAQIAREWQADAVTASDEILSDPLIDAVIICTRHDSHAPLTAQALAAGKAVWVEKPLAMTLPQLNEIEHHIQANSYLLIGHNRRFAPLVLRLQSELSALPGTRRFELTVTVPALSAKDWLADPHEGGTRLIGELSHYLDLLTALVGAPLSFVGGSHPSGETLSAMFRSSKGDIALLHHGPMGDLTGPKEVLEVAAAGHFYRLIDYHRLEKHSGGKSQLITQSRLGDKGHAALMGHFLSDLRHGRPPIVPVQTALAISRLHLSLFNLLAPESHPPD